MESAIKIIIEKIHLTDSNRVIITSPLFLKGMTINGDIDLEEKTQVLRFYLDLIKKAQKILQEASSQIEGELIERV